MKKTLLIPSIAIATVGAFVFYSCNKEQDTMKPENNKSTSVKSEKLVTKEYVTTFSDNKAPLKNEKAGNENLNIAIVQNDHATLLIPENKALMGMKQLYDNKIEEHPTNFQFTKVVIINSDGVWGIRGYASDGDQQIVVAVALNSEASGNSNLVRIVITPAVRPSITCSPSGACVECADERYTNCPCHRTSPPTPGESCTGSAKTIGNIVSFFR